MNRKTILIRINLAIALVLAGTLLAQAQESVFGTWKMNAAKSKYSPVQPRKATSQNGKHFRAV
jgi:hypothetical protein